MNANRRRTGFARTARYAWLPLLLLLGGCGGPSGSDIQAAVQEASNALLGAQLAPSIEDVSNVNCREAQGKPGFVCSFSATTFDKRMNMRATRTSEGRFVQDNSKWVMMGDM